MIEVKQNTNRWTDRNNTLKTIKVSGDFGWMHLVIAENKKDSRKFMRLKRYMNWMSVPNSQYLKFIFSMLKKGAEELNWDVKDISDIELKEAIGEVPEKVDEEYISKEIPEEIIEFLHNHPKTAAKLISTININEFTDEDINYLTELMASLHDTVIKAGKRLQLSFQEALPKITKEGHEPLDKLAKLMGSWSLSQILDVSFILKRRLNEISIFEGLIHNESAYELKSDNSIHRRLEKSMWIINDSYWLAQSNKSLRTFIGDEMERTDEKYKQKRPDFVCVTYGSKLIIIEIKRPSLTLTKDELDQAELYQRIIKKYKSKSYSVETILIGNSISDEAREIVELRKGVSLRTYQDFLEECRGRYQEYLKIIEEGKN